MWRIALKNLLSHKRRLIGTASAVVLGVAFLAGTLVLTDTMRAAFDDIFTSANAGTDVVVQSSETIGSGGRTQVGLIRVTDIDVGRCPRGADGRTDDSGDRPDYRR